MDCKPWGKKSPAPFRAGLFVVCRTFGVGCSPFSYGVGNVKSTSVRFARILPPFNTMWLAAALLSWQ